MGSAGERRHAGEPPERWGPETGAMAGRSEKRQRSEAEGDAREREGEGGSGRGGQRPRDEVMTVAGDRGLARGGDRTRRAGKGRLERGSPLPRNQR